MSLRFNPQQQEAITCLQGPVLLSAGAGSGKTAVLTERIVQLCLAGEQIDRMLVVTFTNAAAAEMKGRIRKRLHSISLDETLDEALRRRAADQADKVSRSDISTLHSFCGRLLRRNFALVGLDPAFRTGDEVECAGMRLEACTAVIDAAMTEAAPGFATLLSGFGGRGGRRLESLILKGYESAMATPDPARWLEEGRLALHTTPHAIRTGAAYLELVEEWQERCCRAIELLKQARDLCIESAAAELLHNNVTLLQAVADGMEQGTCGPEALASLEFGTLRLKKTEPCAAAVKSLRDRAKAMLKGAKEVAPLCDAVRQAELLNASAPQRAALYDLIEQFIAEYERLKRRAGVIDFTDMEQLTLRVLAHEDALAAAANAYDWVFVDEYQDSSLIQEKIVTAIARPERLFCVGDVKQSIYRFRGAEPAIFTRRALAARMGQGVCLPLNTNYRTAAPLLHCVNDLFSRLMQNEVRFDKQDALIPHREENGAALQVHILEGADSASDGVLQEAQLAARLIKERKSRPLVVDSEEREPKWSDFAILMRAVSNASELYCQVFAAEGIPVFAELSGGCLESIEVQVFLSLLRLIDNRRHDVALLAVLRSGIGGFGDEDIVAVRRCAGAYRGENREPLSYFDALQLCAQSEGETARRCREFLGFLEEAARELRIQSLTRFCQWLLARTGYTELLGAAGGGAERMVNVERLLAQVQSYESASARGLSGFLHYIDRAVAAGRDLDSATSGGGDAVRLMSIHKSKGLEFPLVYLVGANRKCNLTDAREAVQFSARGLCMNAYDHSRRTMHPTLPHRALAEKAKQSALQEEQRILYVALTRAREELNVIGSVKDIGKAVESWTGSEEPNSYLHMIVHATRHFAETGALLSRFGVQAGFERHEGRWEFFLHSAQATEDELPCTMDEAAYQLWRGEALCADPTPFARQLFTPAPPSLTPAKQGAKASAEEAFTPLRRTPAFVQRRGLTAADVGSAVHILLEHMDFSAPAAPQIRALCERELLTAEEAAAISPAQIDRFAASALCRRMLSSPRALREQPFTLPVEVQGEVSLIQGVIDACFVEDDRWVILDYKTDRIDGDPVAAAEKHRGQLQLYARALTEATGLPVAEQWVVLLRTGEAVRLTEEEPVRS